MAESYVGEIRLFGGNFAPRGWAKCEGQVLPISEYDMLFNLIGTIYGGDGQSTFALPDLRGRAPVHMGNAASGTYYNLGELAGVESVTVTVNQMAKHNHRFMASTATGTTPNPANNVVARSTVGIPYVQDVPSAEFAASSLLPVGGTQPHENRQPFLAVTFIISLFGTWPPPS
jgi:microcystin-dependent protein